MDYIDYIFKIVVLVVLIYLLYKNKNENFSDLSKQDLEGVQNIASMYKNGELKVAKLHVTDNAQFDKNIKANEKITSKHLHINDHASTRRLDIRNDKTGGHPTHFNHAHSGTNHIRGNTHSAVGKLHCDNLHVNDLGHFKRIDIIPGGGKWNTHLNYHANGENYISGGKLHVRGTNNDRGHIVNGITETVAIRPRLFRHGGGIPEWPNEHKMGDYYKHCKANGAQRGDIIPVNMQNHHHYNHAHWKDMAFTLSFDQHQGKIHGRLDRNDGHNKWARHHNNHHITE